MIYVTQQQRRALEGTHMTICKAMQAGLSTLSCPFFRGNIGPETLIYMPAPTTNNLNFTII